MTAVTYIAKREIASGHVLDGSYSLDLKVTEMTPRRKVGRVVKTPLAGVGAEVIRRFGLWEYAVTLAPVTGTPLAYLREFVASVEDQSFTFDPYGSVAVPGTTPPPFVARILEDDVPFQRAMKRRLGGASDYFQVSFTVAPA